MATPKNFISVLLVSMYLCVQISSGSKILFMVPISTKSHMNFYHPLIKALAARGHQVTVAAPTTMSKPVENVREIVPVSYEKMGSGMPNVFAMRKEGKLGALFAMNMWDFLYDLCEKTYENPEFFNLLNEKFDLVFTSAWANCYDGMVYKLGAPFIKTVTMAPPSYITALIGNPLPPSFVPEIQLGLSHEMSFLERVANFAFKLYQEMVYDAKNRFRSEQVYRKYLGQDVPSVVEIGKNTSVMLCNSYFPLNYPRPQLPQVIEVGGMHCTQPKKLPKDLDDFLTGAEHGFVYFSMGSVVNTDEMPEHIRIKFLNVFSKLKQRVIWKWNSGKMDDLPPNVRVGSWLPQQDILGHPNIKVFMTHGGLLSTQEAAYHGVPLLGIPVFADQDLNMEQAERGGYALRMEVLDFTEDTLESLLTQLLQDNKYAAKAKELSAIIQDQMETPVERAVFWTEYVLRHNGTEHMRSAARHLTIIQYYCLDSIAAILVALGCSLTVMFLLLRACLRKCCKGKKAHVALQRRLDKKNG